VDAAEQWLRAHDLVYDGELEAEPSCRRLGAGGAAPVPQHQFGDDQDRPIEIGRQLDLFRRGSGLSLQKAQTADALVDIWGADGHRQAHQAAVAAMTGAQGH
jgi:arginyl-tRNA synthetase